MNFSSSFIKKILSYFYPITKKIKTQKNGIVEITYYNGKKLLDSKNANYSYGSLQKILKFGINQIELSEVNSILLLGLGGGSVIQTLRNDFGFEKQITAIDIDQKIIQIALEEFHLNETKNLTIIHADAMSYMRDAFEKVDLVIVDIYIDNIVPSEFFLTTFWDNISNVINENGFFIFNTSITGTFKTKEKEHEFYFLIERLKTNFHVQQYDLVEGTNTLLIGKKY